MEEEKRMTMEAIILLETPIVFQTGRGSWSCFALGHTEG